MTEYKKVLDLTQAKIVPTKDLDGNKNGFLMELQKDGDKTTAYLTTCLPGAFKGYHLHKVREANYVVLKGKIKIVLWETNEECDSIETTTVVLEQGDKLRIPIMTPTGLINEFDEEAWIVNFPSPAYDPDLKDEQVDYTEDECLEGKYLILRKGN